MRSRRGSYMARAYAEVAERGPIAAAELSNAGKRAGNWCVSIGSRESYARFFRGFRHRLWIFRKTAAGSLM